MMIEKSTDSGSFVALLEQSERDALFALGVPRAFPRGALLMFEHEPGERVMILLSGRAKISRVHDDGRELLLSIRDPGDLIGDLALIDGQPRLASAIALEPVEALVIPAQAFRRYVDSTPRIAVVMLAVFARRFRDTTVKLSQLVASDTVGRVAARILELAERYGHHSENELQVELPMSQEEFAAWAGASRAGVAHALQTLRDLGWIHTGRRLIVIRDVDALRARSA